MKFCKDCNHAHKEVFNGPQGIQTILLCASMEAREPVMGDMVPCEIARREQALCGIQGKHFVKKEEPQSSVLEIVK